MHNFFFLLILKVVAIYHKTFSYLEMWEYKSGACNASDLNSD